MFKKTKGWIFRKMDRWSYELGEDYGGLAEWSQALNHERRYLEDQSKPDYEWYKEDFKKFKACERRFHINEKLFRIVYWVLRNIFRIRPNFIH